MLTALTSFFAAFKQALSTYEKSLETQTTTVVVKDKKRLKHATDITEEILMITDTYFDKFSEKDQHTYIRLKKRFLKMN